MVEMGIPLLPPEPEHRDRKLLQRMGEKVRRRLAANSAAVRIPAEQAELWAVANFFTAAECAGLIAMIDDIAEPSLTYDHHPAQAFRTSFSANLDPHFPLVRTLRRRIDQLLGIDWRHGEILQASATRQGSTSSRIRTGSTRAAAAGPTKRTTAASAPLPPWST